MEWIETSVEVICDRRPAGMQNVHKMTERPATIGDDGSDLQRQMM